MSQNSKTFLNELYVHLPELLKDCCELYATAREKDVFLLSALSTISGCLPKLKGRYKKGEYHANLNGFIIAPPASGKQGMKHAKYLGSAVHKMLRRQEKTGRFKPCLFIPGSTSPRALIEHLNSNFGTNGILCETEADVIGQVLQQEWGDYSHILRAAFEHETVSLSRVKDFEEVAIEEPKLSVLLSGTPDQFGNIIKDVENGLFSRFMYYQYAVPAEWKDVTPTDEVSIEGLLDPYALKVKGLYEKYNHEYCQFVLSKEQWKFLNDFFSELLLETNATYGDIANSVIYRQGVICFRIAMVLSAIRNIEAPFSNELKCTDDDLKIALALSECLSDHATAFFETIAKPPISYIVGIERFKQEIPNEEFSRKQAVKLGAILNMSERTVDKYLRALLNERSIQKTENYGHYKIVDVQSSQSEQSDESVAP